MESLAAFLSLSFFELNQLKVYLAAKRVDARGFDPYVVAQAEFAAVAGAFDHVVFLVVVVNSCLEALQ